MSWSLCNSNTTKSSGVRRAVKDWMAESEDEEDHRARMERQREQEERILALMEVTSDFSNKK